MRSIRILFCLAILAVSLSACRGKASKAQQERAFPSVRIPTVYTEPQQIADYALAHFWDGFFDGCQSFEKDSLRILGVRSENVEREFSGYAALLKSQELEKAQASIAKLFSKIEDCQREHPESDVFGRMTSLVEKYLYDPNSPLRCEDLYLPFVSLQAASEFTPDDLKGSLERTVAMCSLNKIGTKAANFTYKTKTGSLRRLYDIDSEYTLLIFLNPGCHACEGAVAATQEEVATSLVESGRLYILGVYIDKEIDAWLEKCDELPSNWNDGYDPYGIIRSNDVYNVRAIPSIYLLDSKKIVLLKDVPETELVNYLENL